MPRIMIVDDVASIRQIVNKVFQDVGYQVTEAARGEEALDLAKLKRVHLVITDVEMPGMSGLDLIKALRDLGFPEIGRFTHEFENVLDDLRKGSFEPDADAVDLMLACVDHVRLALRAAREQKPHDAERDRQLLERLSTLHHGRGGPAAAQSSAGPTAGPR